MKDQKNPKAGYYSNSQNSETGKITYWLESTNINDDVNDLPLFTHWYTDNEISVINEDPNTAFIYVRDN